MAGSVKLDVDFNNVPSLYKKRKSPNFKDVLRERCHSRIKARRHALLDKFRSSCDQKEVKDVFCDIIKEEALVIKNGSNMVMDVTDSGEHMAVPLDSLDEMWLLEEYEKVMAEEEAHFLDEWQNQVICPVCEKSALHQASSLSANPGMIACSSCRTVFPPIDSLQSLSNVINFTLDEHDSRCDQGLFFLVLSSPDPGLYTICDSCNQYNRVL